MLKSKNLLIKLKKEKSQNQIKLVAIKLKNTKLKEYLIELNK